MLPRWVAIIVVPIVLSVCPVGSTFYTQAAQANPDTTAILQILDDEGAAWAKGDADAFASHVRDNVVFTNTVGMYSIGKVPFVAQHKNIFGTIYQGSSMRQFVQNISFVRSDTAIVDTISKLVGYRELPSGASAVDGALYTRLEQIVMIENGSWKVASFHNVPIQPKFVDQTVLSLTTGAGH